MIGIIHIIKDHSPTGHINTAPAEFQVYVSIPKLFIFVDERIICVVLCAGSSSHK